MGATDIIPSPLPLFTSIPGNKVSNRSTVATLPASQAL
jgi:hypothetical protein